MIVETLARFWAKVDRRGPEDCWHWTGARTTAGYGQMSNGSRVRNKFKRSLATHVALAIDGRARPSSDHVAMHQCDNPRCVNPAHLEWGTAAENMADMIAKERSAAQLAAAREMDANAKLLGRTAVAKLTENQVRLIRSSSKTTIELADELGVTNQCISNVRLRKTWRHIE